MKLFRLEQGFHLSPPSSKEDVEPKWNMLFPLGKVKHRADMPGGKLDLTEAYLAEMIENWKAMGSPELPVNYCHTGPSHPSNTQPIENRKAAGWLTDLRLVKTGKSPGLYGYTKWNDKAREYILADEFRYLSPEFAIEYRNSDSGKVQGPTLLGVALLNDPFLKEMPRVAASDVQPEEQSHEPEKGRSKGATMDKAKICAALGLSVETEDDKVLKELSDRLAAPKTLADPAQATMLSGLQTEVKLLTEQRDGAQKETKLLSERLTKMEKESKDAEFKATWKQLLGEGKVSADQHDEVKSLADSMGIEKVKTLYAKAPKLVSMSEAGIQGPTSAVGKDEAKKKFDAHVDSLRKDQKLSLADATKEAARALPVEAKLIFSA